MQVSCGLYKVTMMSIDVFYLNYFPDNNFTGGMDRQLFVHYLHHVITQRFHWPAFLADLLIKIYTQESDRDDPIANRDQYVHVSITHTSMTFCVIGSCASFVSLRNL